MPTFQRYRIVQEVNNLEWREGGRARTKIIDEPDIRNRVIELLECPSTKKNPTGKKSEVSFDRIRKQLAKLGILEGFPAFNLETEKRKGLDGDQTANVMQHEDYVGQKWHSWPLEKQDRFISLILNGEIDDEEVFTQLVHDFGLSEYAAENCMNAPLVDGTANISLRAAQVLADKMYDDLLIQSDAVISCAEEIEDFINPFTRKRDGELLDKLPYYGKAVSGHIIPGTGQEQDYQSRFGMISNPTVHIAMNQLRYLVNELLGRYGHPYSIGIELARDLPAGVQGRSKINDMQTENQKKNERINQKLREFKLKENRANRQLVQLWEEQKEQCVFSGRIIGFTELFDNSVQVEHLLPYSRTLDDSMANKVVCTVQANQDKGQRSPFEAFGHNPVGYDWYEIRQRISVLPHSKQLRFETDAMEIWKRGNDDFIARHLNDTRYIGRLAKEYLENICEFQRIDVVTGQLTAMLRHRWGLNSVLDDITGQKKKFGVKNRDDHRHHAIDAIVVCMTNRSTIQKIATDFSRREFEFNQYEVKISQPWDGFRGEVVNAVGTIFVSHKSRAKEPNTGVTDGQLHNATAYGIISGTESHTASKVVARWPIERFKELKQLESIRDEQLRGKFLTAFNSHGKEGINSLAKRLGIRSLRRTENLKVIPIKDRNGKVYKAFKGDSNWGVEIYEWPNGHKNSGKWVGVVIPTFEANQSTFQSGCSFRPHPAAKLVMRLQTNDCVEIHDNGVQKIMRLQKFSTNGNLTFALHNEANVHARNKEKENSFKYWVKSVGSLQKFGAKKVNISVTGQLSYISR